MNLKLLIDSRSNRVLFAEAGKDFVDFLFNLMSLPIGTAISLVSSNAMVGSLGNLYKSIENLNHIYIQPNVNKQALLNPKSEPLSLPKDVNSYHDKKMYVCSHINKHTSSIYGINYGGHWYVAEEHRAICPQCKNRMSVSVEFVEGNKKVLCSTSSSLSLSLPSSSSSFSSSSPSFGLIGGGFVKGVVTYMVMDDLEVTPMSTISSIVLLNKFNIKEINALEEMMVSIGMDEGLKLLKASFKSKTVLTDVFLGNNIE